jgi:transcription elongation factor Elf1
VAEYRPREGDECFVCPSCKGGTHITHVMGSGAYAVCDVCGVRFVVDIDTVPASED